ncbi:MULTISPECIES: ATP-binding cassette domain-containing protein [Acidianus]|uniref:ABC transporter ATPase n=1 Tax=Candidatus Acidianus copahuensis TaxID=1160895 RepID=A0A031LP50_9CREN|nr:MULTISPECIES: ATP-binding cassette domain-containing protein [Acidianus]EZQ10137.1 ABC transporter ATPase [Candidatus Acidianus copahuensis]NON62986.1 ATP-binding cassette domain-containing protein [Acidianus sp. RZ1]
MLSINSLKVSFDRPIIQGIDLHLDSQKAILLGTNGSGKTTIIRSISGIVEYQGEIKINGISTKKNEKVEGFSTNLPEIFKLGRTVNEMATLYEELMGIDYFLFMDFLEEMKMKEIMNRKFKKLSAGQQLIVRNALALSSKPMVYALDEPFENVDLSRRDTIAKWAKEIGLEGILVTHEADMLTSEYLRDFEIYFLVDGKIYGPVNVEELLSSKIEYREEPGSKMLMEKNGKKIFLVKGSEQNVSEVIKEIDFIMR